MLPKDERDLLSKDKVFVIPNINEEARMFEWAGVGFGEEKVFLLSKSIKVTIFKNISNIFLNRDWQF